MEAEEWVMWHKELTLAIGDIRLLFECWVTDGSLSSHRSHWMTCCWLVGHNTLRKPTTNSPRRPSALSVATSSARSGCWSATCELILVKSPSLVLTALTVPTARRWYAVTSCTATTTSWRQHKGSYHNHSDGIQFFILTQSRRVLDVGIDGGCWPKLLAFKVDKWGLMKWARGLNNSQYLA